MRRKPLLVVGFCIVILGNAAAGSGHRSFQFSDRDISRSFSKMDSRDAAILTKAVREILWSASSVPKAAADEDYAAVERYCETNHFINPRNYGELDVTLFAVSASCYKDFGFASSYVDEIDALREAHKSKADPNIPTVIPPDEDE